MQWREPAESVHQDNPPFVPKKVIESRHAGRLSNMRAHPSVNRPHFGPLAAMALLGLACSSEPATDNTGEGGAGGNAPRSGASGLGGKAGESASGGTSALGGSAGAAAQGGTNSAGTNASGGTNANAGTGGSAGVTATGGSAGSANGGRAGSTAGGAAGSSGGAAAGSGGSGGPGGAGAGGGPGAGGGAGSNGGAGAGGTAGTSEVASSLNGLRVDAPCTGTPTTENGAVCQHVMLTQSGGFKSVKTVSIAGTAGTTYDVTLRVRGIVEPTNISGGMRSSTATFQYMGMAFRTEPFTVGGTVQSPDYSQWHIRIASPAQELYLNDYQKSGHYIFELDYEITVPMAANTEVTLDATDSNERQIVNYEDYALDGIPGSMNHGQFVQIDVVAVAPRSE